MREAGRVEGVGGALDAAGALVERVVAGRAARVVAGAPQTVDHLGRSGEQRVSEERPGRRGERSLQVAQREVRPPRRAAGSAPASGQSPGHRGRTCRRPNSACSQSGGCSSTSPVATSVKLRGRALVAVAVGPEVADAVVGVTAATLGVGVGAELPGVGLQAATSRPQPISPTRRGPPRSTPSLPLAGMTGERASVDGGPPRWRAAAARTVQRTRRATSGACGWTEQAYWPSS